MNKIKIMLTAITVFAVVGGALAFKVKGKTVYCDSVSHQGNGDYCPALANSTFDNNSSITSYCTNGPLKSCTATSSIKFEQ